jgi:hypothetical protein
MSFESDCGMILKGKAVPLHVMEALGGRGGRAPTHSRPRTPGAHCTGGWVGPRAGLDKEVRGKIFWPCRGSNPDRPVVQSVIRHYTDWANPAPVEWYWQGKTEELGEKPVPVPLCPPQIPHGLNRAQTRASAVRGRRLTTWTMARPVLLLRNIPAFVWQSGYERGGRIRDRFSTCGICGGQSTTGTDFFPNSSLFSLSGAPYSRMTWGMKNRPVWRLYFIDIISAHRHEQREYESYYK